MTQDVDESTGEVQAETSFTAMLFQMDNGKFHAELTEALTGLMRSLRDHLMKTGDKVANGAISCSFQIRVDAMNFVEIFPNFTVKEPKEKAARRIMFMTPDGKLSARNPNQPDLPFRVIKDVNEG